MMAVQEKEGEGERREDGDGPPGPVGRRRPLLVVRV